MRNLVRFILLNIILSSVSMAMDLNTNEERADHIQRNVLKAKNLIYYAYRNPKTPVLLRWKLVKMWNFLEKNPIHFPPIGSDYMKIGNKNNYCATGPIAFTYKNEIYICGSFLDKTRKNSQDLPHILIHEVAHATDVDKALNEDNECGADYASVLVFRYNGKTSPAANGYYVTSGRCHFD